MTENAGVDPRVAAAEQASGLGTGREPGEGADQEAVRDATGAPDQTQLAEDPTGDAGAYGGVGDDGIADPGPM